MENKNFSENENENEKLFWEQKFSPFSEKFFLENSAQNGLKMGEYPPSLTLINEKNSRTEKVNRSHESFHCSQEFLNKLKNKWKLG